MRQRKSYVRITKEILDKTCFYFSLWNISLSYDSNYDNWYQYEYSRTIKVFAYHNFGFDPTYVCLSRTRVFTSTKYILMDTICVVQFLTRVWFLIIIILSMWRCNTCVGDFWKCYCLCPLFFFFLFQILLFYCHAYIHKLFNSVTFGIIYIYTYIYMYNCNKKLFEFEPVIFVLGHFLLFLLLRRTNRLSRSVSIRRLSIWTREIGQCYQRVISCFLSFRSFRRINFHSFTSAFF